MTFQLKPIERDAIPRALEKAERYRLLNEPWFAESICLDVLAIDPENQLALTVYLLALTDQFGPAGGDAASRARAVLPRLRGAYERCYYAGIIAERQARALVDGGRPGAGHDAYDLLRQAMEWYERAEAIHPPDNNDAVLRYNTCVRLMAAHHLTAAPEERHEPPGDV